jgi:hypothetical protein
VPGIYAYSPAESRRVRHVRIRQQRGAPSSKGCDRTALLPLQPPLIGQRFAVARMHPVMTLDAARGRSRSPFIVRFWRDLPDRPPSRWVEFIPPTSESQARARMGPAGKRGSATVDGGRRPRYFAQD